MHTRFSSLLAALISFSALAPLPLVTSCGGGDDDGGAQAAPDAQPEDLDMKAEDFECILRWTKVNRYRITNKLGHVAETLAVANNKDGGGTYPVGTVIQLVPFEAMVKRKRGYNAATNDWEFFNLQDNADGTTIVSRGGAEIVNKFTKDSCMGCHSGAAPQFDLVCEQTHGCDPLPVGPDLIEAAQQADKRCP
jgi:hypothetical protein